MDDEFQGKERYQEKYRGRENPEGAPQVEVTQADSALCLLLVEEARTDQQPADREEDVDP
jgi:hypothetical protein